MIPQTKKVIKGGKNINYVNIVENKNIYNDRKWSKNDAYENHSLDSKQIGVFRSTQKFL